MKNVFFLYYFISTNDENEEMEDIDIIDSNNNNNNNNNSNSNSSSSSNEKNHSAEKPVSSGNDEIKLKLGEEENTPQLLTPRGDRMSNKKEHLERLKEPTIIDPSNPPEIIRYNEMVAKEEEKVELGKEKTKTESKEKVKEKEENEELSGVNATDASDEENSKENEKTEEKEKKADKSGKNEIDDELDEKEEENEKEKETESQKPDLKTGDTVSAEDYGMCTRRM